MRCRSSFIAWGRMAAGMAGLSVALVAGHAGAATHLVPGKIAIIKPGKLAKGLSKPVAPATFMLDGDPTSGFASLQVFDVGGGAGSVEYALPGAGWTGLGNPAGSKGYKYKGAGTTADPCKVVLVKEKIIKFVCKGDGVTLTPPLTGELGAILTTVPGSNYCATFGGEEIKNQPEIAKRKEAPAPAACAGTPECGDGVQQLSEQCDDNNLIAGDGCNELCELETLACTGGVIGERIVTVSLNVPDIAGGIGLGSARVTINYPEVLMGIPGEGDSSLVASRISGTPNGTILVNDQSGPLTVAFLGLPPNVIPENAMTQFVVADFDSCVEIDRNFCSRNQQVIDCCNDVANDPMQSGCPLNPPVCPAGQFPAPGADPEACASVNGACPTEDFCLPQFDNIACNVSETADENGTPVEGVTCTIDVVETLNP